MRRAGVPTPRAQRLPIWCLDWGHQTRGTAFGNPSSLRRNDRAMASAWVCTERTGGRHATLTG
jgi:hypothetical protein